MLVVAFADALLFDAYVDPRLIITCISPQNISWGKLQPSFSAPDGSAAVVKSMHKLMEKLFVKNGYERLGSGNHYIKKSSSR